ncbi:MAG TPA: hypothetical protein VK369_17145, partial [Segetibacter sp.]|nr:hypothetical protein [Segetibacter sp.]
MKQEKLYSEKYYYRNKNVMLQLMLYTISCIALIYLREEFADLYKSLYAASKTKTGTKSAALNNVNPVAYNELRNEPKAKIIKRKAHNFKQDSEQYKHNLLP